MFDNPLAHLEGEVQPGEVHVLLLEALDDAQGMKVVVEVVLVRPHQVVEGFLARMPEGRMAHVVDKRQRLDEVGVQAEHPGDGAADLGYFQRVSEPVAEMVRVAPAENLRLVLQAAEGARMDNAVTVTLVIVSVGMRGFRVAPAERLLNPHGVAGQLPGVRMLHGLCASLHNRDFPEGDYSTAPLPRDGEVGRESLSRWCP